MPITVDNTYDRTCLNSLQMELSQLVGREITLFTDQFRGKPVRCKVVMANDRTLSIDRGAGAGIVDNLVNNQEVIVQFEYKGQRVSVGANLKRCGGSKCNVVLAEKVVPLARRRFQRHDMSRQVKCAVVPILTFNSKKLSKLRWIETDSVNLSSGGILLSLPTPLTNDTYLLMNVDAGEFGLPTLMLGQVRYAFQIDNFRFRVGVEFIVDEVKEKHFPLSIIRGLPRVVFAYNNARRSELDKQLAEHMHNKLNQE